MPEPNQFPAEANGQFPPPEDISVTQAAAHAQNLIEKPGYSVHASVAARAPAFSSPELSLIDSNTEQGNGKLSAKEVSNHEHQIINYLADENQRLKDDAAQESERRDRREADQQLLNITDELTGVNNRNGLKVALSELQSQSPGRRESDNGNALLLIDLDHFKSVNDTFGHPTGDKLLRRTASQLLGATREGDIVGRWGGEEFVVILPNTDPETANKVAERIRETIGTTPADDTIPTQLTASVGVGELDLAQGLEENVAPADQAMYQAKQQGRNRVISLYGNEAA